MSNNYALLDCGDGFKLEQVGKFLISRPSATAFWKKKYEQKYWDKADLQFSRKDDRRWKKKEAVPERWRVNLEGLEFHILPTDFGHLGIFPEHAYLWRKMAPLISPCDNILNLFAYTGGATLFCAKQGAKVCHVDASKPMVAQARGNAKLNGLEAAPIRWIVEDVFKFLKREIKRKMVYDGIILDPPTFGRGAQNEIFKIEEQIVPLIDLCFELSPRFIVFSCHTPGFTPTVLAQLLSGAKEKGELLLSAKSGWELPMGSYAIRSAND